MATYEPSGTVRAASVAQWHDKKRYLWLIGLVVPSLVFVAIGLAQWTDLGVFYWFGPIVLFVIVPTLDLVVGRDGANPPDDIIEALENDRYYRYITFAFLPIQYAGFLLAMYLVARGDLSVWDKVGLSITVGTVGGVGINTAHELGHKKESHERWLSKIALAQSFYGHFYLEHNRGHHVRVATPEDPASSRMGESFYAFWPRTVSGSLRSAWNLEKRRYQRKDTHPFHLGNDVLNAWLMSIVLWGAVIAWLGVGVIPYLLLQAVFGFSLLEVVNFMEHYGMLRAKVGTGDRQRYERVDPSHSWNSNNIATNVLLYHLQRHSDHHANPTRRYQALRGYAESPVLPTGYAGMIVISLVPPLYRRVMDKRVIAHFDGDLSRANLQPSKRERLLRRYPVPVAGGVGSGDRADLSRRAEVDDVRAARCPGCGYVYEVDEGNEAEGFAAGTAWRDIPNDWCCPDCGVREKVDFIALTESLR
ncbi:fatty acid desaturase [Nocardioides sp.]|uniref:fatty acid desaturase n=1 Tax=Nocardioides sp. TaxID=35761 RepID=UPI0026203D6E|nr:fatty acid desaturase [Nocardioides sp.]